MMLLAGRGLECSTASRLKWRVCALLGIRPYSREWTRLTRRRVLICALHLVLDRAVGCEQEDILGANPNFDEEKFNELRRGKRG